VNFVAAISIAGQFRPQYDIRPPAERELIFEYEVIANTSAAQAYFFQNETFPSSHCERCWRSSLCVDLFMRLR